MHETREFLETNGVELDAFNRVFTYLDMRKILRLTFLIDLICPTGYKSSKQNYYFSQKFTRKHLN